MNKLLLPLILLISYILPFSASAQIVAGRGIQITMHGVAPEEKGRIDGYYAVSSSGTIRLPLLNGDLSIGGLSPSAAAAKIEAAYKNAEIYSTATFQVLTSEADGVRQDIVTITGFVRSPGPKPYNPGMTLITAVAAAGDVNEFGNKKQVLLMRGTGSKLYDLNDANDRSIAIQPNDVIEVKEKSWFPGR